MGDYRGRRVAAKALRVYLTNDFDKIRRVSCLYIILNTCMLTVTYVEVLQGSDKVESPQPSERVTAAGSDDGQEPLCDGVGVDGKREHQRVYRVLQGR